MLHFKTVRLKNWKNFGNVNIDLMNRMFIAGANASGKSNFLDVFRFLRDISIKGLTKAVLARGGLTKIRNLNARNPSYIDMYFLLEDPQDPSVGQWEYQLQFNTTGGTNKNQVNMSLERVVHNGQEILHRKYHDDGEDATTRQFTHLEQPAMNKEFRILFETFQDISYVNIIPQLIRESESFLPSVASEDYYGRNLLSHISETNKKKRDSRLKKINEVLKLAVPQFSELRFVQDDDGKPHLQVRYEHFRPQGARQQEDQFSDGTLRLIGLLWAILDGEGLMLLEEPENYLHSEIVKQLPMFIANAQKIGKGKIRQVFIASHSFDLLNTNTVSLNEIAVLEPTVEDTIIKIADNVDEIKMKVEAGFTPADAVIPHVAPSGIANGQLSIFDLIRG